MVAGPIGNLDDITLRALKVLEAVDVVACEDTRHTGRLLTHFNLKKRCIACHSHNEEESAKGIVSLLDRGQDVAYMSDAGTPGISDPGARLVEAVRAAGHEVVPIPGASAFVTLLSAAGNVGRTYTFEGFLSPKRGRRVRRLEELVARGESFSALPTETSQLMDSLWLQVKTSGSDVTAYLIAAAVLVAAAAALTLGLKLRRRRRLAQRGISRRMNQA